MADTRIAQLAEVLVNYSVAVRPGDRVVIGGSTLAEPLLKELYARVLQAEGHPLLIPSLPDIEDIFFRYASDDQIKHVPKPVELIMETYDVRIGILANSNTKSLANVPPAKLVMQQQARTHLTKTFLRRAAAGELRWVLAPFPTNAFAQDAEMSLSEYEDFVYSACLPDKTDPVGYWQRFSATQEKIIDWLKDKTEIHITGKDTDLKLSVAGRVFKNGDGHYNIPDGEIFTGPVEDSAEGHVYFSYPTIYDGKEVTGVRLWFEHGKVVKASAEKNEGFLLQTLDTDPGARFLGEFAIGTNEGISKFTRQILFDEKIGGSFHLAVGAGYPETGSKNESAVHWDMICDLRDGGEIQAGGELLYQNGRFIIPL
ncbi:MAG: aminopeptidase [Chloroflexi bacterium]|nr:aminopeptidase [Chloroflexota bacterium]